MLQREFLKDGFTVIYHLLTESQVEALRLECETLCEYLQHSSHGLEISSSCIYQVVEKCDGSIQTSFEAFKSERRSWPRRPGAANVLLGTTIKRLVTSILGPEVFLFNEQYIVKPSFGGVSSSFGWHRDSDWCRGSLVQPTPYISLWIALDDCTKDNGCICIDVDGKCCPIPLQAGSAIVMLDSTLHCSGPNQTQFSRRAYMAQFSSRPILEKNTRRPLSFAVPFTV